MDAERLRARDGGDHPLVMLATGHRATRPDHMARLLPQGWRFRQIDQYALGDAPLDAVDVLVIPDTHDQIYLHSLQARLVSFLAAGGHLLVNGHITLPWLPYLAPFIAVPPRPYTNWMIRPAHPGAYFGRMDFANFHVWDGILGQYARGYSEPPDGAQKLCLIGSGETEGPCDWVWRAPGGGKLFMHNGDDIDMFCSDPEQQPNLIHDILRALVDSSEP